MTAITAMMIISVMASRFRSERVLAVDVAVGLAHEIHDGADYNELRDEPGDESGAEAAGGGESAYLVHKEGHRLTRAELEAYAAE